MDQKLDLILQRLEKLDVIENELALVKSQLHETTRITKALVHGQEEIKAQLDSMGMDLHKLTGRVSALEEGQQLLIRNVDALAMRSIQHEVEIKELKRVK